MNKIKVGVIGSGNIGTDLMMKIQRSPYIEMAVMIGIDPESEGLQRAEAAGVKTITNGIEGFLQQYELADILFDATSAKAHVVHVEKLSGLGKKIIDLTPAAIGPFVIPTVNLTDHIEEDVVNMVTCGGQATIPIIHAINSVQQVEYAEIVATIASKSAGPGTRANIDEFTETTSLAIEKIGGATKGKAIILLNPAEPPLIMRDTILCTLQEQAQEEGILEAIQGMVAKVNEFVPGYRLKMEPLIDEKQVSVFLEVEGLGDYLPVYAGNLDIMTAAALKVGEEIARKMIAEEAQIR